MACIAVLSSLKIGFHQTVLYISSSSEKKVIYNLYICTHGIFKCGIQNNDYRHLIEVALNVCPNRHFRSLFKQCCDVKQRTQTYTTLTRDEKLWQNLHE